jgi:hypothetical protein
LHILFGKSNKYATDGFDLALLWTKVICGVPLIGTLTFNSGNGVDFAGEGRISPMEM